MGRFQALEQAELFKDWRLEDRAALAHFLEKQELKSGEQLFFENSAEQKFYLIERGRLKLQYGGYHTEVGPGESLGELSLIYKAPKQINTSALENCLFWVITESSWARMKIEAPLIAMKLMESAQIKFSRLLSTNMPPPNMAQLES